MKQKSDGVDRNDVLQQTTENEADKWRKRMRDDIEGELLNPEEYGRHFEGDIILFPEQAKQIYENALKTGQRRVKRKFIGSDLRRWDPTRPIVYSFDGIPGTANHRARLGALAQHHMPQLCPQRQRQQWKSHRSVLRLILLCCERFFCRETLRLAIPSQTLFLVFTDVDGCASNVGRHPLGEEQLVSLAPECIRHPGNSESSSSPWSTGTTSHASTLSATTTPTVEIASDSKGQFLKEDPDDVDNAGVPYDYGSIMHYRSKAFSRYDDLYTISTFVTDYQKTIGQRDQLSFNDIRLMNKIYCSNLDIPAVAGVIDVAAQTGLPVNFVSK
ncbi:astacin [Ostertagia ostertagi]